MKYLFSLIAHKWLAACICAALFMLILKNFEFLNIMTF